MDMKDFKSISFTFKCPSVVKYAADTWKNLLVELPSHDDFLRFERGKEKRGMIRLTNFKF